MPAASSMMLRRSAALALISAPMRPWLTKAVEREEFVAELEAGGFVPAGPVMPVVYDSPWAGAIDALGGLSFGLYARLARWKRAAALRHPEESTGFQVVAHRRP